MANVPAKRIKVSGKFGSYGEDGATFVPSVSEDGTISWENDKGMDNPQPINIRGPQGIQGPVGPQGKTGPQGEPGDDKLPDATADDNDKILQVVNGEYSFIAVKDSAVAAFIDNYIGEVLGGEY